MLDWYRHGNGLINITINAEFKVDKVVERGKLQGLASSDVLIVSFPKTGSTFTRFVFANLVNLMNGAKKPVDFYSLGQIMPECLKDDLTSFEWHGGKLPRLVKTHQLFESHSLYSLPKALYLLRDPRDTMISFYYYASKRKSHRYSGTFEDFIADPKMGIPAYNQHIDSWLDRASWVFKYEDMMQSANLCFRHFIDGFDADLPDAVLENAISFSRPTKVKELEQTLSRPNHQQNFDNDFTFVRDAGVSQWKDKLSRELSKAIWDQCSPSLQALYDRT